jgi:hypothetical protein
VRPNADEPLRYGSMGLYRWRCAVTSLSCNFVFTCSLAKIAYT